MKREATDEEAGMVAALALITAQIVDETDISWARVYAALREARRMHDRRKALGE